MKFLDTLWWNAIMFGINLGITLGLINDTTLNIGATLRLIWSIVVVYLIVFYTVKITLYISKNGLKIG